MPLMGIPRTMPLANFPDFRELMEELQDERFMLQQQQLRGAGARTFEELVALLFENDPNQYGPPPAAKKVLKELPTQTC